MKTERGASFGFSLVELLIAITILGFILTLLFAAFRVSQRSWDSADQHMDDVSQMQIGRQFLSNVVTQAFPFRWKQSPTQRIAFSGTSRTIRLIAELPANLDRGGLRQIFLDIESHGETSQLVFRNTLLRRDALDFDAGGDDESTHVIIGDQKSIKFSYFGPESSDSVQGQDRTPRWSNEWLNSKQLPTLVRIEFDSSAPWPDLFIAPVISQEGACLWNDFYKRCVHQ